MLKFLSKNSIYVFYSFLMIFTVIRTSESAPNPIIRFGYLLLFFLPLIFRYEILFPACLISFMTVGIYGFAYNFFPYQMVIYPLICLFVIFFNKNKISITYRGIAYVLCSMYILLVNLLDSGIPQDISYSFFVVILLGAIIGNNTQFSVFLMLNCFCVISLSLSLIYLINYDRFLINYNNMVDMERSGWTDPNYLSCIIGMGIITSLILLIKQNRKKIVYSLYLITCILVSLVAQILLASRGAILAVAVSVLLLLLFLNLKIKYKILILFSIFIFTLFLYERGLFDLLEYRIINDDGSGSGRTEIWDNKLTAFFNDYDFIYWVFGLGYDSAFRLAGNGTILGFHNDFLAILCGYGLIGGITFIYFLLYPIYVVKKNDRPVVLALISYLILICLTLEPIAAGRLTYFGFYFLIYIYSINSKKNKK